jgi:hypothetical protein
VGTATGLRFCFSLLKLPMLLLLGDCNPPPRLAMAAIRRLLAFTDFGEDISDVADD